jgi:hypothetical protein
VLGGDKFRDQSLARLGPAEVHLLADVGDEALDRPHPAEQCGRRGPSAERLGKLHEPRPVFRRQAEQLADHCQRERPCQSCHEIDRLTGPASLGLQVVKHPVDDRLEPGPQVLDAAPDERLLDQSP